MELNIQFYGQFSDNSYNYMLIDTYIELNNFLPRKLAWLNL